MLRSCVSAGQGLSGVLDGVGRCGRLLDFPCPSRAHDLGRRVDVSLPMRAPTPLAQLDAALPVRGPDRIGRFESQADMWVIAAKLIMRLRHVDAAEELAEMVAAGRSGS
jgi:hypothetical protein